MLESKADKLSRILKALAVESDAGARAALIGQLPAVREFAIPEPEKPKPKTKKAKAS
jgi:hypothetical protein